ncbi:4-hydroxybenzoate polyprenyltransferase [invertebrate metagenome]|uniref:4-hydroxybenzoate polyprenyltransferase n=1 Tax=invertebrate metagenome TaxID=1711999 RepID=A0A484H5J1_9ZZZZ
MCFLDCYTLLIIDCKKLVKRLFYYRTTTKKKYSAQLVDLPVGGWIDYYIPPAARPYLQLMRLDRPIGMWLLLLPCCWSLVMARDSHGMTLVTTTRLVVLFTIGALVMRGAGCTYNDIVDRNFDSQVTRTASRPIPSGAISLHHAILFLMVQCLVGFFILIQLNAFAISLGTSSLALVFSYPFMKRITFWPQLWLGLTFNWGGLLGWSAVAGALDIPAVILYVAGLFWTLGYDTIYAHQDREDDMLVGVKSSALVLGEWTRPAVAFFYTCASILAVLAGLLAGCGGVFVFGISIAGIHLVWQVTTLNTDDSANCLARFRSNRWYGWLVLVAIITDGLWP